MFHGTPTITAARRSSFVKHISSFDYAQDGEPVEPYLANKDETPALSFLHFMRYERQ